MIGLIPEHSGVIDWDASVELAGYATFDEDRPYESAFKALEIVVAGYDPQPVYVEGFVGDLCRRRVMPHAWVELAPGRVLEWHSFWLCDALRPYYRPIQRFTPDEILERCDGDMEVESPLWRPQEAWSGCSSP